MGKLYKMVVIGLSGLGLVLGSLQFAASQAADATRYLAFQMFTDWTAPGAPVGESGVRPLGPPRGRDAMSQFVQRLVEQIGSAGDTETKLAFIIGPLAFDYTDDQLRQMIADAFAIALEQNIAVGFHIDDSMFWARRSDLWQDPANVEWLDWEGTPNTGRMIGWGPEPTRLAPQMCFNSPAIEEAVRHLSEVIGSAVSDGIATLEARDKPELFAGVLVGWETMIGRDFETHQYLGYCALTNRGFSGAHPPEDLDREREQIVQAFIELWAAGIAEAGIDPAKIYSHTAVIPAQSYEAMRANQPQSSELTYSQVNQFAPPSVAFSEHYRPGFSTYPQPGLMEQLYDELEQHGSPAWASSEGANIDPATLTSGGGMETYLAWMFNHGAALVNIFGWGLPPETNPFRLSAEAPNALTAYRKFLDGEPLVEGEYAFPDLPERIQRIQTELPAWLQQHSDRQAEIETLLHELDGYITENNYAEASRVADEILAIITLPAQSNTGLLVFGECDSAGVSQIVTYDLGTGTRTALTDGAGMKWYPAWSPDGNQIAYVYDTDSVLQIWIMNADGSDNHPLVTDGINMAPSWSPDGTHIAYAHADAARQPFKLWLMRVADGAHRALLPDTPAPVDQNDPRFSPDSRQIVFTSNRRDNRYEIWVFDVHDPSTLRPLTTAYHDNQLNANIEQKVPAWSPDGTQIAYWQGVEINDPRPDLPRDVWVVNADGSDPQLLTRGDDPNWSPDGSLVIHSLPILRPEETPAISAVSPDGTGEQVLLEVRACRPLQSDWTGGVETAASGG